MSKKIYVEDDNYGYRLEKEEHEEFLEYIRKDSVKKKCSMCYEEVIIRQSYDKCNSCMEKLERGEQW